MASHFSGPLFGPGRAGSTLGARGRTFYVDPYNGSDSNTPRDPEGSNTPDTALATLQVAHDTWCEAGRGDTVVLIGNGQSTGTSREIVSSGTTCLAWSKDSTHLIGADAPVLVSQRSRVSTVSTDTTSTILLNMSADNCVFSNVQFFLGHSGDVDQICAKISGERNYFENVHFAGIGHATTGDRAASRSLWLAAGSENLFKHCTIGLDTIARSTTNAEIEFTAAATRNYFEDCLVLSYADNAGHLFVKAASAGDIDRWAIFKNCEFINSGTSAMTVGMTVHASAGGVFYLPGSAMIGATDIAAGDSTNIYVYGAGLVAGADNIGVGLAVLAQAS